MTCPKCGTEATRNQACGWTCKNSQTGHEHCTPCNSYVNYFTTCTGKADKKILERGRDE